MDGDWKWRCFLEIETLDCPICAEPLSMPVYQCENGHPICSSCSTKVSRKGCPSCFRPTGRIRCLTVEKILESLLVPCKHGPHGCKEMLPYSKRAERDDHEKQACEFQSFPCLFPLCSHEGPLAPFSSHLADAHGVRRTKLDFQKERARVGVAFRMSSEESCMMIKVEKPADSDFDSDFDSDVHVFDVLIVAHRETENTLGDWFFCTVYGAPLMKYKLKVKRADGRSESAMHNLKAIAHDSSRESVRAACEFVDRLLVPIVPNADEDDSSDDNEVLDTPASITFGESHKHQETRKDIEYEQRLREAIRRSMEDRGRQHGHDASYEHDRDVRAARDERGSLEYSNALQGSSQSGGGSHGSMPYTGSSHVGSQYYPVYHESTLHGSYGHHRGSHHGILSERGPHYNDPVPPPYTSSSHVGSQYYLVYHESNTHGSYGHQRGSYHGVSSQGGSQHNDLVPPPTFGRSYYGNYREGGSSSRYGYNNSKDPYSGSSSTYPHQEDDNNSDLE